GTGYPRALTGAEVKAILLSVSASTNPHRRRSGFQRASSPLEDALPRRSPSGDAGCTPAGVEQAPAGDLQCRRPARDTPTRYRSPISEERYSSKLSRPDPHPLSI